MTWIKICGTTNLEDALMSVEAGADALGFVFYENSPRYIDPEKTRKITEQLPAEVEKVGVFVNGSADQLGSIAELTGLTGAQLHLKVFPKEGLAEWTGMSNLQARYLALPQSEVDGLAGFRFPKRAVEPAHLPSAILLDSGSAEKPGGTGKTFDWNKARSTAQVIRTLGLNLIVAGGLNPSNVTEAIRILNPWGVDVVSGVEASPGKKDPEKVRAFIAAVRQTQQPK